MWKSCLWRCEPFMLAIRDPHTRNILSIPSPGSHSHLIAVLFIHPHSRSFIYPVSPRRAFGDLNMEQSRVVCEQRNCLLSIVGNLWKSKALYSSSIVGFIWSCLQNRDSNKEPLGAFDVCILLGLPEPVNSTILRPALDNSYAFKILHWPSHSGKSKFHLKKAAICICLEVVTKFKQWLLLFFMKPHVFVNSPTCF